jgi:hypothetical protein
MGYTNMQRKRPIGEGMLITICIRVSSVKIWVKRPSDGVTLMCIALR